MNMPERQDENPLIVSCGIRLLDITKIDTNNYGFSMSVFLQFTWTDNRIIMEAATKTDQVQNQSVSHNDQTGENI